jgi:hypothetical protein
MNPLGHFLKKAGIDPAALPTKSKLGKVLHRGGVKNTPEVQRILELPAYRWQDDEELEELGRALEDWLALPPRVDCKRKCGHQPRQQDCPECIRAAAACVCRGDGEMHLRPVQVAALQAIHDVGGMLGPIRVGGGKTLISYLAGVVSEVDRMLLLVPAKLRKKTLRDFALLKRHWRAPARMHLMSFELLARDRGIRELQAYRPDLIVADEAHKLKNTRAACTKRVHRYLTKENPEARYVDMSGTITKRSIMEYYHRQNWAIPDGLQPLPRKYHETKDWADAIDEKTSQAGRLMPGALLQLCSDEEIQILAKDHRKSTAVRVTREGYCRRLMTAPGVVGTEEQFDGAMSLQIQAHEFALGPAVVEAFRGLRDDWALPDGHPIDTPIALWRHARELVQGFYYKWDPPPPPEWLIARRSWAGTVREVLKNYRDIDSPLMVTRAVEESRIPWAKGPLAEWRAIKDTFKPNTVAEWIDDACLQWVAKWASDRRGIIWVSEVAFGKRLAEETGLPYYGAKGLCNGRMIEDETQTCIASIAANSEGRNLQQFNENLIVSVPPGGAVWEQLLGRTHRDGQDADDVSADVLMCCYEQWDVFRRARRDAEYIERTTAQVQKLCFADIEAQEEAEIMQKHTSGDPLWCKDNADFFDGNDTYTAAEQHYSSLRPDERVAWRQGLTNTAK